MISSSLKRVTSPFRMIPHCILWRLNNKHNFTHANSLFTRSCVTVGKHTYGPIEILYDSGIAKIEIGNYCSIAKGVKIFAGGGHDYRRISTYPFQSLVYHGFDLKDRYENLDIFIGDDVWIGYDCIILPGSHIGKGSVIGARSVVTGTIPPFSVYVGNKVIKSRFSQEVIEKIKDIDFSSIEHMEGDKYQQYCTARIDEENVDMIIKAFMDRGDEKQ